MHNIDKKRICDKIDKICSKFPSDILNSVQIITVKIQLYNRSKNFGFFKTVAELDTDTDTEYKDTVN